MKEAFDQEDIVEFSAHLEAARIESLRVAKEEKKRWKEEARAKLVLEIGSNTDPTRTREPLPGPIVLLPHDEDTQVDTSSFEHEEEQVQGGDHVPQQGGEQPKEPVQLGDQTPILDSLQEQATNQGKDQQAGLDLPTSLEMPKEQEGVQIPPPRPDLVDIPHRARKDPYVELAKVKIVSLGEDPIKFFQLSKTVQKEEVFPKMRIDLTQSLSATKPPTKEAKDHPNTAKEEVDTEKIDLTKSLEKETPSDKSEEDTQDKKVMSRAWKWNKKNIKHRDARQVHQHTVETTPQVGAQFIELLEKDSLQSIPSFLTLYAMSAALTEAMKGLSKLAAMTILKNATSQVAKNVNTAAVVQLMMDKNVLV